MNPRRTLRYGLGILWLIDALLQLQPGMFHPAFYGNLPDTLMPSVLQAVRESTVPLAVPAVSGTQWLFIHFPILTNLFITAVQAVLAALLLLPVPGQWRRVAAIGSVVWGVVIWVCGEGLGGLFSWGDMNFYSGFPGPALLYAFASLMLALPEAWWASGTVHRVIARSMAILLLACALLQVLPQNGQWRVESQMSLFGNSGFQTQPAVLSAPVMAYTLWLSTHAIPGNIVETIFLIAFAAIAWKWSRANRMLRASLYLWLFMAWWFGMDFGYLTTGLATDPNTPPMLAVLLASIPTIRRQAFSSVSTDRVPETVSPLP